MKNLCTKFKALIGLSLLSGGLYAGNAIAVEKIDGEKICPSVQEAMYFFSAYVKSMDSALNEKNEFSAHIGMRIETSMNQVWVDMYPKCAKEPKN